jgi:tyrosine-protein phosphatase YwqE
MVHAIASDAHDPVHRHPRLDDAFRAISAEYGADIAELLFRGNPGRIIEGKYVSSDRFAPAGKRKWWQFWASDPGGDS